MKKALFEQLYAIHLLRLNVEFLANGEGTHGHHSTYIISLKIRLSIALRYFVGGSVYDIMLVHGVSLTSVYVSVWVGTVLIKNYASLAENEKSSTCFIF
jgi:hypothetical protein